MRKLSPTPTTPALLLITRHADGGEFRRIVEGTKSHAAGRQGGIDRGHDGSGEIAAIDRNLAISPMSDAEFRKSQRLEGSGRNNGRNANRRQAVRTVHFPNNGIRGSIRTGTEVSIVIVGFIHIPERD